jgi:hypothetical protein
MVACHPLCLNIIGGDDIVGLPKHPAGLKQAHLISHHIDPLLLAQADGCAFAASGWDDPNEPA